MGRFRGGGFSTLVLVFGLAACSPVAVAPAHAPVASAPSPTPVARPPREAIPTASPLTEDQRILHVLNRLGYGPRPGDLERVKRMGLTTYIERQLDPRSIPDGATDQALTQYRTLTLSAGVLVREYPRPSQEVQRKQASGEMSPQAVAEAFPPERRPYRVLAEMQAAKVTRAILSERQLEDVMVAFWLNHFNVFAHKGPVVWMLPSYEREAIRPHALGRFRDLVAATARQPAMLFYLDNWTNVRSDFAIMQGPNRGRTGGLNENYARELMELHTLGVDGGYTQQDVIEVARCFTGWSIDRPQQGGGFVFRPRTHDADVKRVLGHLVPAGGGEQDGMKVIDLLVRHPSTARFISAKLVRRFVSDDPPPALVDRAAATFRQSDGDIRAVLVTIFSSNEFFSREAYRAKIKMPLEAVASAARAVGARIEPGTSQTVPLSGGAATLARQVGKLGEPLYEAQPPTGYPERAEAWVNTGALLNRMNYALALAQNRLPGVRVDLGPAVATADRTQPEQVLDRLIAATLNGEASPATRAILMAQLESPEITRVSDYDSAPRNTDVEKLAALVLGSPEFQRR